MGRKKKPVDNIKPGFFDVDKEMAWYKEAFESKRGAPKPVAHTVSVSFSDPSKPFVMRNNKTRV